MAPPLALTAAALLFAAAHGAESPSATSTTASNGRQLRHNNERRDGALWQQWTTADLVSSGLPCTPEESVRACGPLSRSGGHAPP